MQDIRYRWDKGKGKLTGSMPTTMADLLWSFLMARDKPVTVPPVPAPAMMASTLPDDGRSAVPGVDTIASMISGPVVSSCASGLLGL